MFSLPTSHRRRALAATAPALSLSLAVTVLAGPVGAPALAASPQRGVAPLLVPDKEGKLHTATDAHISFRLPRGTWEPDRPLSDGFYSRVIRLNGKRCTVSLVIGGRGKRLLPSLTTTPKSDHIRRGVSHGVHWLSAWSELPPTPPLPYAKAYRPAPSWVTWNWAAFDALTQVRGPGTAACRRLMLRIDLAAVARSARVEHGGVRNL